MPTAAPAASASILGAAARERFERDGFAIVPGFLEATEMERYRAAALAYADARHQAKSGEVFRQLCQVWRQDAILRELTFHPRITAAVSQLAGRPMRLYHDQVLIKDPKNGQASEFHQDRPYWPLSPGLTVSTWIALGDCPTESGCMSFIPGSQHKTGTELQVITWARALFDKVPELEWSERVVAPLRAGGITFHQGWTAHRAGPNETDTPRVAFSAIYVEDGVTLTSGADWPYPGAKAGQPLSDEGCPRIN
jgi:ectoine hydroxylase-related dioxygenase (phytanoyl-CoA dioxygenase family)